MARLNTSRKRTQRGKLKDLATKAIEEGAEPYRTEDGKLAMNIDGRHYVLPDKMVKTLGLEKVVSR